MLQYSLLFTLFEGLFFPGDRIFVNAFPVFLNESSRDNGNHFFLLHIFQHELLCKEPEIERKNRICPKIKDKKKQKNFPYFQIP